MAVASLSVEASSLRPAHVHTHSHTDIKNNGGISHLKQEWLYYLAITLHLPWNTIWEVSI